MKAFSNYETAKKNANYEGSVQLPEGAYVCKIMATKYTEPSGDKSGQIAIQFDVIEGEYKDFFRKQYDANQNEDKKWKGKATIWEPRDDGSEKDDWTKNAFARWTNAIEDSNPGYSWDWDESKWKGKIVGILFGKVGTVIEGKEIEYTEASRPLSVDKVRAGDYKPAKFRKKNGYSGNGSGDASSDGFMEPPKGEEEEIPF